MKLKGKHIRNKNICPKLTTKIIVNIFAKRGIIEVEEKSETNYIIGTNITHFYPLCVEFGRGEVRPIRAKALHWFTLSGTEIFSQYSSPAPPRPFVKPAFEETNNRAVDIVKVAIYNATI